MSETRICQVCNQETPKYKCPHCQLRYCALSCFKRHIADHETLTDSNAGVKKEKQKQAEQVQDDSREKGAESNAPASPPRLKSNLPPCTSISAAPGNPLSAYDQLTAHTLFNPLLDKYPSLISSLRRIYHATVHPQDLLDKGIRIEGDDEESLARRWGGHEMSKWTAAKADERAVGLLLEMQMRDDAFAEFVELALLASQLAEQAGDTKTEQSMDLTKSLGDGDASP